MIIEMKQASPSALPSEIVAKHLATAIVEVKAILNDGRNLAKHVATKRKEGANYFDMANPVDLEHIDTARLDQLKTGQGDKLFYHDTRYVNRKFGGWNFAKSSNFRQADAGLLYRRGCSAPGQLHYYRA